jgi:hypothetical protein
MTEEKETFYYRHNIMNEVGYHRPVTIPISMSETLTLRDQFAMAALTGILANDNLLPADNEFVPYRASGCAYEIADAMLEARKEKK